MNTVEITIDAVDGDARLGRACLPTGRVVTTPCFMPVGTRGAIRGLDADDLRSLGVEVLLANTYHLMLKPGADVVARSGGLHRFTGWDGPMLTDSGGFQVFSLQPKVDDDGRDLPLDVRRQHSSAHARERGDDPRAARRGHPDGARRVSAAALDATRSCAPRSSARRRGPTRAKGAHRRDDQALFGIVQGGIDERLRVESAERTVADRVRRLRDRRPVRGGAPRRDGARAPRGGHRAAGRSGPVPHGRRRSRPGSSRRSRPGVDLFDCVLPTRHGRHGTVLTDAGRLNLRNARFADRRRAARPRLPVPRLRDLVTGLPPPPALRAGGDGPPARDDPQRRVDPAVRRGHARRDPQRAVRRRFGSARWPDLGVRIGPS